MSFQIGQVIPCISITYVSTAIAANLSFNSYLPWQEWTQNIKELKIFDLTVTEQHKVPSEHNPEDSKYDGFKLVDVEGISWHNNYPHADTSGSGRKMFDRHIGDSKQEFDIWFDENPDLPCEVRGLTNYLSDLKRGIYYREHGHYGVDPDTTEQDRAYTKLLIEHMATIIALYKQQSGNNISIEPRLISAGETLPGWYTVTIVNNEGESV